MSGKPVRPRAQARRDIEHAIDYYLRDAGAEIAFAFYAHELALPGLRAFALRRYPYLAFYVERDDHIDVWRVLHARRDIPARMGVGEGR